MADLSGTWLGTYWQAEQPTRFEATLVQGGSDLSGRIQDDNEHGESQIAGSVIGRRIQFTKQYLMGGLPAIEYTGEINTEEDLIQGTWRINNSKYSGRWEARRSGDDLMQQLRRRLEQKIPAGIR
jgi:hypothetical protein